jgi:uncharacterized damage-inducible protein DinB
MKEQLLDTFVHMPPARILSDLGEDDAGRRAGVGLHSIAEVVAHMLFWQEWFMARCEGKPVPMASKAADGWPSVPAGSWPTLRARFLTGAETLAGLSTRAEDPITPSIEFPPLAHYTVRDALIHVAQHNSHHLGQVIGFRQALGLWPPPGGGWTC